MRIVYLLETARELWGGVRSVLRDADRLAARGHEVVILARSGPPDWMALNVEFRTVPAFVRTTVPEADLVVATYWTTVPAAVECRRGVPVHYCQGYEAAGADNAEVARRIDAAYALREAHKVTIAPHLATRLAQRFGQEVHQVTYAVETEGLHPGEARPPGGRVRVGLVGPYSIAWKGIATGIAACELAHRSGLDVELVRISNTARHPEELRPGDLPIEWHECVPPAAMGDLYRSLDVMLGTSLGAQEGFFLPVVEAMACGVPCVLTEAPCFTDHARHGRRDYALFVEPGDAEQTAEALVIAAGHRALRTQLREAGLDIARAYDPERHVDELEGVFDALCRGVPVDVIPRRPDARASGAPGGDLTAELCQRAELLASDGDHEAAAAHFEAALCLRPGDLEVRERLGCERFLAGDHDAALDAFDAVLQVEPARCSALERRGLALIATQRFAAAAQAFARAARLPDADAETYNNLGVALYETGDLAGARAAFARSLQLDPGHADARANLDDLTVRS